MDTGTVSRLSSAFDSDMYLNLLLVELKNQNPEEPVNNSEMVQQISSLSMVEGMNNLNTSFGQLLDLYRMATGSQMVGKQVEYSHDGGLATGTVDYVNTGGDSVKLVVAGREIGLDQVTRIL
jgi:flagellar basal-body rod modification protein FlgD